MFMVKKNSFAEIYFCCKVCCGHGSQSLASKGRRNISKVGVWKYIKKGLVFSLSEF